MGAETPLSTPKAATRRRLKDFTFITDAVFLGLGEGCCLMNWIAV
jgi:hypothetical protein